MLFSAYRLKRWLLLMGLLLCTLLANAGPLRLQAETPTLVLTEFVEIFEDGSGQADLESVQRQASFSPAMATLRGRTDAVIWLRMSLVNASGQHMLRWLSVSELQMPEVSLFLPGDGGWQRIDAGTRHPAASWPVDSSRILLPVSMPSGQALTLYVRVVAHHPSALLPVLWEPLHYRAHEAQHRLTKGLLLGSLLLMPLIGVLLYLMLQDRAFLFNSLAMLTFILGEANVNGFLYYYVWPAWLVWPEHLPIVFRALGLVWHVLFLQTLLVTRQTMPALHLGLRGFSALILLALLCIPLGVPAVAAGVVHTTGLLSVPFMALVGWMATRKQIAGARYFTLAFVVLTLGSGLDILARQFVLFEGGWVPYVLPLSMLANNVLVLFSAVDRILLLRREKELAQKALVDHLKNHEAELSAKVQEKTASLSRSLLETRQAKDALTRLLGYISHDLRAPLAGILNTVNQLTRRSAAAEVVPQRAWAECRRSIELSVHNQFELIDDLIDYAEGELREFSLAPVPTYFYSWCQDIVTQTEHLAQKNGNQLQIDIPPDIPPALEFDPRRLRQVLVNLLANAAKFTHEGTVRLQIRHAEDKAGALRLSFSVADSGKGIAVEEMSTIFEPFQQGRNKSAGNGLGLSIAQSLITSMGGKLDVVSSPDEGSTFSFVLTFPVADAADIPMFVEAFGFPTPFGRGKTVLIADSQETIRDYLAEVLHAADFDVIKVGSGEKLLQYLAGGEVDLLITDQFLPDLPMAQWLHRLQALAPHLPALVLCTASPCQNPDAWAKLAPVVLLKPVRAEQLLQMVSTLFDRAPCRPARALHEFPSG